MTYKSIVLKKFGGPEVLEIIENDTLPIIQEDEVLIKVLATSAAYTDTLVRKGIYPELKEKPPLTPGYDLVGKVEKIGSKVSGLEVGQKVAELTITGSYSEYVVLPANRLVPVPEELDPLDATSLILSYVTAYQMLTRSAKVQKGQSILVHGAAGAVGSALIQLGQLFELKMFGTASQSQYDNLLQHGCIPIDYQNEDFVEKVLETNNGGVHAVFDGIGGDNFKRSLKTLKKDGILVAFGTYHANSIFDMAKGFLSIKLWNLIPWIPSTTFYSIGDWHTKHREWFNEDLKELFQMLSKNLIRPVIVKRMKLEEAAKAHELLEKGENNGKIILVTS